MIERTSCDACGSSRTTYPPSISPAWPIAKCLECGFVYLPFSPPYSDLDETLAWEKTSVAETERRRSRFLSRLDMASRWRMKIGHALDFLRRRRTLGLEGNVLDVGCGGACRIPDGPIPFGIEISRALARAAKPTFTARGGSVTHGPAIEGIKTYADGFFSAILMRSYLDHEAAPLDVLRLAHAKLIEGGKIHVRVPNHGSINRRVMGGNWCGYRFPDHVSYFTPATLKLMAERAGLAYRRVNWMSPFDDNIIAELSKSHVSYPGENYDRHNDGRLDVVVSGVAASRPSCFCAVS